MDFPAIVKATSAVFLRAGLVEANQNPISGNRLGSITIPYASVDPDVVGPGISIAFLITGFLVLFLCILIADLNTAFAHSIQCIPDAYNTPQPSREPSIASQQQNSRNNPLTAPIQPGYYRVLTRISSKIAPAHLSSHEGEDVAHLRFNLSLLSTLVSQLSDQQLLFSLIFLPLAIFKYNYGLYLHGPTYTVLSDVSDVAFFSSVSHGITLLFRRTYFRRNGGITVVRGVMILAVTTMWIYLKAKLLAIKLFALHEGPKNVFLLGPPFANGTLDTTPIFEFDGITELGSVGGVLTKQTRFSLISGVIADISAIATVFYTYLSLYTSLYISDLAIAARAAITWQTLTSARREVILKWVAEQQAVIDRPSSMWQKIWNLITRRPYCAICRAYVDAKGIWEQRKWWFVSECMYSWGTVLFLQSILMITGGLLISIDVIKSGISGNWDFGQLLAPMLGLLPLYNLVESYYERRKDEKLEEAERLDVLHHGATSREANPNSGSTNQCGNRDDSGNQRRAGSVDESSTRSLLLREDMELTKLREVHTIPSVSDWDGSSSKV